MSRGRGMRALGFVLGGTSVASLLAWVYGLGTFRGWFLLVSMPGQVLLIVLAVLAVRRKSLAGFRELLLAGTLGGLVGTFGYDLFRLPFVLLGMRVLAPIDSYGLLAAGAAESSAWTGLLGWTYHFANGIGFGIAWVMLAPGRHWRWGVAWAMVLETATVVTPFATLYALRGAGGTNWRAIAIAYAAHVPFGWAVGRAAQDPGAVIGRARAIAGRFAVPGALTGLFAVLVLWQAPWSQTLAVEGAAVADGASALIVDGQFEPEWLRVPIGGCVTFENRDPSTWSIEVDPGSPVALPPGRSIVCFREPGVHRVRTSDRPYAGGFLIVDRTW